MTAQAPTSLTALGQRALALLPDRPGHYTTLLDRYDPAALTEQNRRQPTKAGCAAGVRNAWTTHQERDLLGGWFTEINVFQMADGSFLAVLQKIADPSYGAMP